MPQLLPLRLGARRPGLINPGLERIRTAAAALGHPETAVPAFRIAGTNGKGSTAAMLDAILGAHGLRTGLYTSPHLVRIEERIRLAGRDVDAHALEAAVERLDAFPNLSFFETMTLAAWLIFRQARLDAAILEVGLGGRWDATSIAPCAVAALTNIGTDHARWLGNDRRKVASEKAAALKGAMIAVLGPGVDRELLPRTGGFHAVDAAELVSLEPGAKGAVTVDWGDGPLDLPLPLSGAHQRDNLHLALAMAHAAVDLGILESLDPGAVRRGLRAVRWPARLSTHTVGGRTVLLDGAHNREAAASLARHLEGCDPPYNLLFSCLDDKPVEAMAALLMPVVRDVAVFPLDSERAMPLDRLQRAFPAARTASGPLEALTLLPDPVVAAGSLRVAGALLEYALKSDGIKR
ncbi:MAG: hypothetical protein GXP47_08780 [Acidobacteria bacterium]|nr:hypothetical protein [Acidobacteriota bacterium]